MRARHEPHVREARSRTLAFYSVPLSANARPRTIMLFPRNVTVAKGIALTGRCPRALQAHEDDLGSRPVTGISSASTIRQGKAVVGIR